MKRKLIPIKNQSTMRDSRISEADISFWNDWLPYGYIAKAMKVTGYSEATVRSVKRGRRYNLQIATFFNSLATSHKNALELKKIPKNSTYNQVKMNLN